MLITTLQRMALAGALSAAATVAVGSCGSSSSSPSSSSGSSPTSPTTPPSDAVATTTITIANNVASPKNIKVARGSQVTFINNDSQSHFMASDPHPDHTDCPEINSVGAMSPGQTKRTDNMVTNRTVCGFHDHDAPNVAALQGSITIE